MLVRYRYFDEIENLGDIMVLDIDTRYLSYIEEQSKGLIDTLEYDVRNELPKTTQNHYHTALTDPAYTVNGIVTFAYRCHQATTEQGSLYLSMPKIDPQTFGEVQLNLLQMGWTQQAQYNRFNEYTGASIHAHVSNMYIWDKWKPSGAFGGIQTDCFYTAERNKKG
jgi:predicted methyltransferase